MESFKSLHTLLREASNSFVKLFVLRFSWGSVLFVSVEANSATWAKLALVARLSVIKSKNHFEELSFTII